MLDDCWCLLAISKRVGWWKNVTGVVDEAVDGVTWRRDAVLGVLGGVSSRVDCWHVGTLEDTVVRRKDDVATSQSLFTATVDKLILPQVRGFSLRSINHRRGYCCNSHFSLTDERLLRRISNRCMTPLYVFFGTRRSNLSVQSRRPANLISLHLLAVEQRKQPTRRRWPHSLLRAEKQKYCL